MTNQELRQTTETLASAFVLMDADDSSCLQEIAAGLKSIREGFRGKGKRKVVTIAREAESSIEALLAGAGVATPTLREAIECSLTALQDLFGGEKDAREVAFRFQETLKDIKAREKLKIADNQGDAVAVAEVDEEPAEDEFSTETESSEAEAAEPAAAERATPTALFEADAEIYNEFIAESNEHVESIESLLLALEKNSDDVEALNALFRAFHTIKGVSAHLGLDDISALSHETESLLDCIRLGETHWETSV
ncbi:MAG: Hpt domain-containing protein, partial [Planctomycetota bacterium]